MAYYSPTGSVFLDPLYDLWLGFRNLFPGLIAAIIIVVIGYFIAWIIGHAVRVILEKIKLDDKIKKAHFTKMFGHTHVPAILGEITKWYIFVIFLQQGIGVLKLGTLTTLLTRFVGWLPNLIAAFLVIVFGLWIAHYVEIKMTQHTKMKGMGFLSRLVKIFILIMIVIVALKQIGLQVSILENAFLLLVGAFAVGLALALGISLGLGSKGGGQSFLKNLKKHF